MWEAKTVVRTAGTAALFELACSCMHTLPPLPFKISPARAKLSSPIFSSTVSDTLMLIMTVERGEGVTGFSGACETSLWFLDDGVGAGTLTWRFSCPETGLSFFPTGSGIYSVAPLKHLPCY